MDKKRIVITGIGVVAPNGIGKEEFWANCLAGVSGIKPVTLFDTSKYRCHHAGEISNFQPEKYLGPKGLRNLDRTTLLALVASKLALDDAKLEITKDNAYDVGAVLGSTMGSVHSISSFDIEGLREGPRYVNPALFPNTVINSPASQVSIRFGIKGLNTTIGTGFTAATDAIDYAMDMLRLGRVKSVLVGGVEELCLETFSAFYEFGLMTHARNGNTGLVRRPRPQWVTDQEYLGEGAAVIVLELLDNAISRNAPYYSEILSVGYAFDGKGAERLSIMPETVTASITYALEAAGVKVEDVECICGGNESSAGQGKSGVAESGTPHVTFGDYFRNIRKVLTRSLIGECFSAMGALELVAGIGVATREGHGIVLINNFGLTGACAAITLRVRVGTVAER